MLPADAFVFVKTCCYVRPFCASEPSTVIGECVCDLLCSRIGGVIIFPCASLLLSKGPEDSCGCSCGTFLLLLSRDPYVAISVATHPCQSPGRGYIYPIYTSSIFSVKPASVVQIFHCTFRL